MMRAACRQAVRRLAQVLMLAGASLMAATPDRAAFAGDPVTQPRPAPGQPPDLPGRLVIRLINHQLEIDRRVTSVWSIAGHGSAAQTLADIQAHWGRMAVDAVWQSQHAGWLMIARRTGDRFEAVQIREQGDQISGYVTRWRDAARGERAVQAGRSWLPPSVEAVTEVVSGEAGARVTTWVGSSNLLPDRLLEQFGGIARAQGLRPATQARGQSALHKPSASDAGATAKVTPGPQIERYVGPSVEFVVTLEALTGKTAVVAHRMEFKR